MKQIYLLLIFLFSGLFVKAQVTIDSVKTTESTCLNNGTLTAFASGGTSYLYALVSPSTVTKVDQSSNVFTSLPSGTYTLRVKNQNGDSAKTMVTVAGNYAYPDITGITIAKPYCPNASSGSLTAIYTAGSATPMQFYLLNGTGTILSGPQASPVFSGLAAGTYSIRIQDACGIVDNYGAVLSDSLSGSISLSKINDTIYCDSLRFRVSFNNVAYPIKFAYTYLPSGVTDTITYNSASDIDYLKIKNDSIQLFVKDYCGRTYSIDQEKSELFLSNQLISNQCGKSIFIKHETSTCPSLQFCYKLATSSTWICQSSDVTPVLPAGTYDTKIIDPCCGNAEYLSTAIVPATDTSISVLNSGVFQNCVDNTGYLRVSFKGTNNLKVVLKSVLNNFTGTADNNNQIFVPQINYNDTLATISATNFNEFRIANLPLGTYQFEYWDDCSPTHKTISFTIDNVKDYNPYSEVVLGCPGFNKLRFTKGGPSGSSNTTNGKILVYNLNTGAKIYDASNSGADTVTINNLASGDYKIVYNFTMSINSNLNVAYNCPDTLVQTLTIPPYTAPNLTSSISYNCSATQSTVVASATGVQPMMYSIREVGTSTFSADQSSNIFTGLDATKTYEIQAKDPCNNNSIYTVSTNGVLSQPSAVVTSDCGLTSSMTATYIKLTGNKVAGANYAWINSSGTTLGNSNVYTISPVVVDSYIYAITIPGASGSVCVTDSFGIMINNDTCGMIALPLKYNNIKLTSSRCVNYISWSTSEERNAYYAQIERSNDSPNDFYEIGRVFLSGNSSSTNHYRFEDKQMSNYAKCYYRVKFVDFDGNYEYSKIVFGRNPCLSSAEIAVSPNPSDGNISIVGSALQDGIESIYYEVYDLSGKSVYSGTIKVVNGVMSTKLNLTQLSKGMYLLQMKDNTSNFSKSFKIQLR